MAGDVLADVGEGLADGVEFGLHSGHVIAQGSHLLVHLAVADVDARVGGAQRWLASVVGALLGTA